MNEPKCNITLCRVPMTYCHQLGFNDLADQESYFNSKALHTFENCRYQPRNTIIKVQGYVDSLLDSNYGFYENEYKGIKKRFYFWIVEKNYMAREVTSLTIQIDVFQTWFFDMQYAPCMIERTHVDNDTLGLHTLPEDFELGDYKTYYFHIFDCLSCEPDFFIGVTDSSEAGVKIGGLYGSTYTGFAVKYFKHADYDSLSDYIQKLCDDGKADAIAFIFTFPSGLLSHVTPTLTSGESVSEITGALNGGEVIKWSDMFQNFKSFNSYYVPYNNKIFTYPYNFLTIKSPNGGNVVLKFELFDNIEAITFDIEAVVSPNPTIRCVPRGYNGREYAIDDSISMQEYGLCSWNNDNFANWFAQHKNSIATQSANASASMKADRAVMDNNYLNAIDNANTSATKGLLNTGLSTLGSLMRGNIAGGASTAVGGIANTYLDYNQAGRNASNSLNNSKLLNTVNYQNTIASLMASVKDSSVQPNTCKGSTTCGLNLATGTANFSIEQTAIKAEYAKIIDMYWQMFGYKVNTISAPNFKTREKWNYVKTVNCNAYGDIPFDDIQAINNLLNNGLTVWHGEENMFHYASANPIRS